MARIIPSLNKHILARMTSGERRVAQTLAALLEDDYLVWYDIPVATRRRYPDFIILHPSRGLLFLEIKDWKPETLKRLNKSEATLHTERGQVIEAHPLDYRNTREILGFAYGFARHYLDPLQSDDDHIPLIEPEAAGHSGPAPVAKRLHSFAEELDFTCACINKWRGNGVALKDIAVLYANNTQGAQLSRRLKEDGVPHQWLGSRVQKMAYDAESDALTLLTIHSSKGLEFERVIMIGIGQMEDEGEQGQQSARLLYVGMTRARRYLLMASSGENEFSRRIVDIDGIAGGDQRGAGKRAAGGVGKSLEHVVAEVGALRPVRLVDQQDDGVARCGG